MTWLFAIFLTLTPPPNRVGECVTGIPPMPIPCAVDAPTTTTTTYTWTPPQVPATYAPPPVEGKPYAPPKSVGVVSATARAKRG